MKIKNHEGAPRRTKEGARLDVFPLCAFVRLCAPLCAFVVSLLDKEGGMGRA
jgi:hypothetical protein